MPFFLTLLARVCVVLLLVNAASAQSLSYVGSDTCADCHADQADLWKGSQHALAWTRPAPQTMLGDFNDAEFDDGKTVTRFSTREGEYFVSVTEMDGQTTQYKVHSTAGIAPLQQYRWKPNRGGSKAWMWSGTWRTNAGTTFIPIRICPLMTGCTGAAPTRTGTPAARNVTPPDISAIMACAPANIPRPRRK